jgi:IS30 family transposase
MGCSYDQLSLEERFSIAELHGAGRSIRQIAAALDRQPSTISRELKRNRGSGPKASPYQPAYAQKQTDARRWSGARLDDGAWRHYLPLAKCRRGRRRKKIGSPALLIKHRISIHQRPPAAQDRRQPGHWEADFMLFARYGQSVLVLHERTSRLTAIVRTESRKAEPTAGLIGRLLEPLPPELKLSLTFDNGTEFAEHHRLSIDTFFCDPHAPWQKGGVENAVGRFRRFLPRRTDLQNLAPDHLVHAALAYNHTPRRCLDFQTPAEVFSGLLHFKWESTSRLSPGCAGKGWLGRQQLALLRFGEGVQLVHVGEAAVVAALGAHLVEPVVLAEHLAKPRRIAVQ